MVHGLESLCGFVAFAHYLQGVQARRYANGCLLQEYTSLGEPQTKIALNYLC